MIRRRRLLFTPLGLAVCAALPSALRAETSPVKVVMDTALGPIFIDVFPDRAPITAGNFLAYIDKGLWKGASFYRVVRPDNDHTPTISVIQGGLGVDDGPLPPIKHETTAQTGIRHTDGVLSMARGAPGTAACDFFICLGDNPSLDYGGLRNPDGQGFATFAKVTKGMDIVRAIDAMRDPVAKSDFMPGQELAHRVAITAIRRA